MPVRPPLEMKILKEFRLYIYRVVVLLTFLFYFKQNSWDG